LKKTLKTNWPSFLIALLVMAYGGYEYPNLPDKMVSHFNLQGNPDAYASKAFVVFFLPLFTCLLVWLLPALLKASPSEFRMKNSQGVLTKINLAVALFLGGIQTGILVTNLYPGRYRFATFISLAFGAFLVGSGNLISKTERNFFLGIRTPWTLTSDRNWEATHRFAGRLMFGLGLILMLGSSFSDRLFVAIAVVLAAALLPVGYSYWFFVTKEERPPKSGSTTRTESRIKGRRS
jgi:uncharacterized membrane protein